MGGYGDCFMAVPFLFNFYRKRRVFLYEISRLLEIKYLFSYHRISRINCELDYETSGEKSSDIVVIIHSQNGEMNVWRSGKD